MHRRARSTRVNRTTQVPSSQVAPSALQRASCGLRVAAGGGRARRRAGPAPETSARKAPSARSSSASGELARSFGGSAARSRGRWTRVERVEERRAALVPAVRAVARVEGRVDVGGRGLRRRRAGGGRRPRSPAAGRAARARCRRRSRAAGRRRGRTGRRRRAARRASCSSAGGERLGERVVREPERGRGVGAAAAEAGGDRDAASRSCTRQRGSTPAARGERARARARTSVSPGSRRRGASRRLLELDPVDEVDAAGRRSAPRACRRRAVGPTTSARLIFAGAGALHPSASASATNSRRRERLGADASARRPIAASAAAARSREREPGERERVRQRLAPVRERGRDDLLDARDSPRGSSVRRKATSAESTFGGGRKTVRETGMEAGSLARRAGRAPRPRRTPSSRGSAKSRSATSRCTITHQSSTFGSPSRLSTSSGVATLYGRFATSFVASVRQVELERVAEDDVDVRARRRAGAARATRSISTAWTWRDALGEVAREDAHARADLEHDVVRPELGEAADHAEDVRVDEEVLAELLLRRRRSCRQTEALGRVRVDLRARARPAPPRAPARAPRACGRRTPARSAGRAPAAARGRAQSVSARIRSAGTCVAARRRSTAFGKVALPANETYQPRSSAVGAGAATRSSGGRRVPSKPRERRERVVVGGARVDHDRLVRARRRARAAARRGAAARRAARSRGTSRGPSPRPRRPSGARAARATLGDVVVGRVARLVRVDAEDREDAVVRARRARARGGSPSMSCRR